MSLLGRIGGAIKGAVGGFVTGGPAGALGGAAIGAISSGGARRPPIGAQVIQGAATSGLSLVAQANRCPPGTSGVYPLCVNLPGGQVTGGGAMLTFGEAVMARYGAALVPASRSMNVRRCPKGAVLGDDGYCYNKRDLRKDQRAWPPGRKPLLTGGDLNAIAKASRAARRMKVQQRRLESLGLLKRPKPSRGSSRGVITKSEASRALRS